MQTFDQALVKLVQQGMVTEADARDASTNPHDFMLALRGSIQNRGPKVLDAS
jgi:Tfp pilus assembly ATPase PilU